MRYTLLELVQRILESMESDEVNSINDTVESLSVANIIKECYFDIIGSQGLPEKNDIFQLTASGDNTKPVMMFLPTTVLDLDNLKYNSNTVADPFWYDVQYLCWDDYIAMMSNLDTTQTNVDTMTLTENGQTFTFKYKNDIRPMYYTTFNDRTLLFDSFDSSTSSTLTGSKTLCRGAIVPIFTLTDTYTPDLDARQFQLLLQSAKSQSFVELKQVENPKAEKKERRNTILAQRTKTNIDRPEQNRLYRGYGRK